MGFINDPFNLRLEPLLSLILSATEGERERERVDLEKISNLISPPLTALQ